MANCYTNLQRRRRDENTRQDYPQRNGYHRNYEHKQGYEQNRGYQKQQYQGYERQQKRGYYQERDRGYQSQEQNGRGNYNGRIAAVQIETEREERDDYDQNYDRHPNDDAPISEERIGAMY